MAVAVYGWLYRSSYILFKNLDLVCFLLPRVRHAFARWRHCCITVNTQTHLFRVPGSQNLGHVNVGPASVWDLKNSTEDYKHPDNDHRQCQLDINVTKRAD